MTKMNENRSQYTSQKTKALSTHASPKRPEVNNITLDERGMSNVRHCQDYYNKKWIKLNIEQEWCADLHQS